MIGDIIQPTHLIFVLVVALLVLGPKRLPEVGRQLGKGLRDFRGAMSGLDEQRQDLFDSAKVHIPPHDAEPEPEPVMATAAATSAMEPSSTGAGTAESPALAPRSDDLPT